MGYMAKVINNHHRSSSSLYETKIGTAHLQLKKMSRRVTSNSLEVGRERTDDDDDDGVVARRLSLSSSSPHLTLPPPKRRCPGGGIHGASGTVHSIGVMRDALLTNSGSGGQLTATDGSIDKHNHSFTTIDANLTNVLAAARLPQMALCDVEALRGGAHQRVAGWMAVVPPTFSHPGPSTSTSTSTGLISCTNTRTNTSTSSNPNPKPNPKPNPGAPGHFFVQYNQPRAEPNLTDTIILPAPVSASAPVSAPDPVPDPSQMKSTWVPQMLQMTTQAASTMTNQQMKPQIAQRPIAAPVIVSGTSPQEYFFEMLRSRGYPGTKHCSLEGGYHSRPTRYQTSSYGLRVARAIQRSDDRLLSRLLRSGLSPNACNRFGESIVHAACRRSDAKLVRLLLESGSSVQVSDDFGRTPMHDALWTPGTNFDTAAMLLDRDPWLLCVADCRGSSPLSYVRRANWPAWLAFLGDVSDRYWPTVHKIENEEDETEIEIETDTKSGYNLNGNETAGSNDDLRAASNEDNAAATLRRRRRRRQRVGLEVEPPLANEQPNTRPLPRPRAGALLTLERAELLASGKIDPDDDSENPVSLRGGGADGRKNTTLDLPCLDRRSGTPVATLTGAAKISG